MRCRECQTVDSVNGSTSAATARLESSPIALAPLQQIAPRSIHGAREALGNDNSSGLFFDDRRTGNPISGKHSPAVVAGRIDPILSKQTTPRSLDGRAGPAPRERHDLEVELARKRGPERAGPEFDSAL